MKRPFTSRPPQKVDEEIRHLSRVAARQERARVEKEERAIEVAAAQKSRADDALRQERDRDLRDLAGEGADLTLPVSPDQGRRLRAQARLEATRQKNERLWATHPWYFLRDAVYTLDQQKGASGGGARKFPADINDPSPDCPCWKGGCRNYLHHIIATWYREQKLLMPKSRRLLASWTMVACHYWLARYRPGSTIAFASRKQGQNDSEGSAELVKRAFLIHKNLPLEAAVIPVEYTWCRLKFPETHSEILGIAQGAEQARQYTYTAYLADEFAFWEWAAKSYEALIPTLEGGGRFTAISTPQPSHMKHLVYDEWQTVSE